MFNFHHDKTSMNRREGTAMPRGLKTLNHVCATLFHMLCEQPHPVSNFYPVNYGTFGRLTHAINRAIFHSGRSRSFDMLDSRETLVPVGKRRCPYHSSALPRSQLFNLMLNKLHYYAIYSAFR